MYIWSEALQTYVRAVQKHLHTYRHVNKSTNSHSRTQPYIFDKQKPTKGDGLKAHKDNSVWRRVRTHVHTFLEAVCFVEVCTIIHLSLRFRVDT